MKFKRWTPLVFALLLIPAVATAQDDTTTVTTISIEDQRRLVAPSTSGETGLFTTITGDTLRQGDWSFSVYWNNYDYLLAPAPELRPPSRRSYRDMDVDHDQLSASIGVGLTDRWEFVASLPYHMIENNAGDLAGFLAGRPVVGKFDESGLGNVHLATKFGLFDPNTTDARLALSLFADLPTGDEDVTSGGTDYGLGVHWTSGIFSAAAAYKITGERDGDDDLIGFDDEFDVSDEVHADLGLNIPLRFWPTTNWINEINYIAYQGGDRDPDDPLYLVTGIRHWFGTSGWAMSLGVRANATMWQSDNNSCPIGGLFGLHYAPLHLTPPPAPAPPPPVVVPEPVAPPPPPVVAPRGPTELRTDEIHFEPGSARLTNIAKAILDDVALRMKQETAATAVVIGYTDDREQTGPNRDLDRRRAEAVRDYLVSRHGIDPSRISVEARGTQDAAGDNTTADGRLRNRRVVIRLIVP